MTELAEANATATAWRTLGLRRLQIESPSRGREYSAWFELNRARTDRQAKIIIKAWADSDHEFEDAFFWVNVPDIYDRDALSAAYNISGLNNTYGNIVSTAVAEM